MAVTPKRLGTAATIAPNVTNRPPRSAFRQVTIVPPALGHTGQQPDPASQSGQPDPGSNTGGQANNTSVAVGLANASNLQQPIPVSNAGGQAQVVGQGNQGGAQQHQYLRPWYEQTPHSGVIITTHNQAYFEEFRNERIPVVLEQLVMARTHQTFLATIDILENVMGCITAGDLDGLRKLDFTAAGISSKVGKSDSLF